MNRVDKFSIGTKFLCSVNNNEFNYTENARNPSRFVQNSRGHVTLGNSECISLRKRRKYRYYEEK